VIADERGASGGPAGTHLRFLTLNLLNDVSNWARRAPLVLEGIRSLAPDVIALQEVNLEIDNARWLAEALGGYRAHVASGTGRRTGREGLAILSRWPSGRHESLSFGKQGRIAQRVVVDSGATQWTVANAHLHWSVYDDYTRRTQARTLLSWLPETEGPTVVCGDFNARPGYRAVATMLERFASAQSATFGREAHATFPTALDRGRAPRHRARAYGLRVLGRLAGRRGESWRDTLDYIFLDRRLRIVACHVALGDPAPDDPRLFASDHVALMADLEWPDGD
jgi:endonuclease/exonuclease/phosphatase family metal-dependent hydrolase